MREWVLAIALCPAGTSAGAAGIGDGDTQPRASMTCERVDGPGRVRCEVEARVTGEESISWGDVVILKTPAFAQPLRGRIGPHEATVKDPGVWHWALALVAREKGSGDVEARVRLVLCRPSAKENVCRPIELDVAGRLTGT